MATTSGREVSKGEHQIDGQVFVGRPTPTKGRRVSAVAHQRQARALKAIAALKRSSKPASP